MNIFSANNSRICYLTGNHGCVNDYYDYLVVLTKHILLDNPDQKINVFFGNCYHDFQNDNRSIRINLNWEHTLVKPGGRDTYGAPLGNVPVNKDVNYLVRIDRFHELNNADIVVDYSIPNIYNVKISGLFENFSKKHVYVAASIVGRHFIKENRDINCLTTFLIIDNSSRRFQLLENIRKRGIENINVSDCFGKTNTENLYKKTKIILNIRQTDHHDTLEELRVLPALQCGVIVISEDCPLKELVPYSNYIIWTTYDNILDKYEEVIKNYDYYHNLIFTEELKQLLDGLHEKNYKTLKDRILVV